MGLLGPVAVVVIGHALLRGDAAEVVGVEFLLEFESGRPNSSIVATLVIVWTMAM